MKTQRQTIIIPNALYGDREVVVHGNFLTCERFTVAYTAAAHRFLANHGDPFSRQKAEAKKAKAFAILSDDTDLPA